MRQIKYFAYFISLTLYIYLLMKGFEEAKLSDDNLLDSIRQRKEHMEKGIENLLD